MATATATTLPEELTAVVPIRPEEVPKDLICSICLSVPLLPSIVKSCCHVFCRDCIRASLAHQGGNGQALSCPVCRTGIPERYQTDVVPLCRGSKIAYRIWSNVAVKCQQHEVGCGWTGCLSDYQSHWRSCPKKNHKTQESENDKERIRILEEENRNLTKEYDGLEARNRDLVFENDGLVESNEYLREANDDLERRIHHLEEEKKVLEYNNEVLRSQQNNDNNSCSSGVSKVAMAGFNAELLLLKAQVDAFIQVPIHNGRGGYLYHRDNILDLAKLICQNLQGKPDSINVNKIFECVRNIHTDLKRMRDQQYLEASDEYIQQMRMLLTVCQSSTWFTYNQQCRIDEFLNYHLYG